MEQFTSDPIGEANEFFMSTRAIERRKKDINTCGELSETELLELTVFYKTYISHGEFTDRYLRDLAPAYRSEATLVINSALKPTELFLLAPVIKRSY